MNHAINRESIATNLIGGPAKAIHTACNPVVFGCFQDVKKYDYNPDGAKKPELKQVIQMDLNLIYGPIGIKKQLKQLPKILVKLASK